MIELKNVTKTYAEGNPGLSDVSLQIDKGEFVFIVGGSGSGKTTLLKLLIAEDKPDSGSIRVADQSLEIIKRRQIPEYRRKIGIVFRDFRLFTDKTVYENVAFALRVTGAPSGSIRTKVMASLQMVELSDKVKCYPGELTGCEQQRVALARAIAGGPSVIIADEPCGNIDPVESRDLLELFGRIQSRYEKTVLVLTHDRELAESFGHRVVRLKRGQIVDDRAAYVPDELEEVDLTESAATEEDGPDILTAESPTSADDSTMEYDLTKLIVSGELDAHTADDLVKSATQILEPASDDTANIEDSPTVVIPVIEPEAESEDSLTVEIPAVEPEAESEDSPTVEIPAVEPEAESEDSPTVEIPVVEPEADESAKEENN